MSILAAGYTRADLPDDVTFTQPVTGEHPETWDEAVRSWIMYGTFPWMWTATPQYGD